MDARTKWEPLAETVPVLPRAGTTRDQARNGPPESGHPPAVFLAHTEGVPRRVDIHSNPEVADHIVVDDDHARPSFFPCSMRFGSKVCPIRSFSALARAMAASALRRDGVRTCSRNQIASLLMLRRCRSAWFLSRSCSSSGTFLIVRVGRRADVFDASVFMTGICPCHRDRFLESVRRRGRRNPPSCWAGFTGFPRGRPPP